VRVADFFSGIGGFSLGLERAGHRTVSLSEIDPYCCRVLAKHWPEVPNLGDIRELDPAAIPDAELWCGGFPCQPFSVAGKRRATDDERDLWPAWHRLIAAGRPAWIFGENVPGLLSAEGGTAWGRIVRDLDALGYVGEWTVLGARDVGAPHCRERLWIVCHVADAERSERRTHALARSGGRKGCYGEGEAPGGPGNGGPILAHATNDGREPRRACNSAQEQGGREPHRSGIGSDVADALGVRELQPEGSERHERGRVGDSGWWDRDPADSGQPQPIVGRVAHGVPHRVDRLRGLGNAVVPQVVEVIARRVWG
jgi:DNA (cytosine-5)-methyltransferase 1